MGVDSISGGFSLEQYEADVDRDDADLGGAMRALADDSVASDLAKTAAEYADTSAVGGTLADVFSTAGNSIGDTLAGIGDGLGGAISGGLNGVKSVLGALGINTSGMGSMAIQNLSRGLLGSTGLTAAQLQNLVKATGFTTMTPAQQAVAIRNLQQQHAQLVALGASTGLASDGFNYNGIYNTTGSAATGGIGQNPSVGVFGGDGANASNEQALRDFMIQKGYGKDEMDAVFVKKDPTVRMAMRGLLMKQNEEMQAAMIRMMEASQSNHFTIMQELTRNLKLG